MEREYQAVLIKADVSRPDRLYCEKPEEPRLWPILNGGEPRRVAELLTANGLKAEAVTVNVKVVRESHP